MKGQQQTAASADEPQSVNETFLVRYHKNFALSALIS